MDQTECIFCKIIAGKIHGRFIAKNDEAVAVLDAFPLTAGHTLVLPRAHMTKIQEASAQQMTSLFELVRVVARAVEKGTGADGSLIAIHNGKSAGQEIPHMHVHIVPRSPNDGGAPVHTLFKSRHKIEESEMDSLRNRISSFVNSDSEN